MLYHATGLQQPRLVRRLHQHLGLIGLTVVARFELIFFTRWLCTHTTRNLGTSWLQAMSCIRDSRSVHHNITCKCRSAVELCLRHCSIPYIGLEARQPIFQTHVFEFSLSQSLSQICPYEVRPPCESGRWKYAGMIPQFTAWITKRCLRLSYARF